METGDARARYESATGGGEGAVPDAGPHGGGLAYIPDGAHGRQAHGRQAHVRGVFEGLQDTGQPANYLGDGCVEGRGRAGSRDRVKLIKDRTAAREQANGPGSPIEMCVVREG
jgi:hypothetical protein